MDAFVCACVDVQMHALTVFFCQDGLHGDLKFWAPSLTRAGKGRWGGSGGGGKAGGGRWR
jgi:hypothetical protein